MSQQFRERVLAIALCIATMTGTLALFGSVPLLAQLTSAPLPFSTGQNGSSADSSDS